MDPDQTSEWREIRAEQAALRTRLEDLDRRLARFEQVEAPVRVTPPPLPLPVAPPPVAPVAPAAQAVPAFPFVPSGPVAPPMPAVPTSTPKPKESIEMRIGGDWLVRAGVVILLTALPFLGNYLYRNIVPHLGPWSKVGLLYAGAGTLAGLGAWLERTRQAREVPRVRNYARVLLAGGLAAVYYVTYAAHYYPNLRVIGSPLAAGLLLMGWTAFMVWVADRRASETVATFAILLAYYTSAVNEIAGFTLVSNLPLTAAAVFLLRRHLWKIFPFASLLATFGSYGYWRYFHVYAAWRALPGQSPVGGSFWVVCAFLLVYWLLFTWAVFSTSGETLPAAQRAGFASMNNGAFFLLVTWSVLEDYPGSFWKWSLGFGVVLLGLAEVGRQLRRRLDVPTEDAYRLSGVLLATLGFVTYFTGWQLCLVLAVESAVLLAAAGRRPSLLLIAASMFTAVGAFLLAVQEMEQVATGHFKVLAPAVGAILVLNGWLVERVGNNDETRWLSVAGSAFYELPAVALAVMWGEQYFAYEANFSWFVLAGGLVFVLGLETRRLRWTVWSYVLAAVGLGTFCLGYGPEEHRKPLQLVGMVCLAAEQQYSRRRGGSGVGTLCPPAAQAALMIAAVLCAWVTWSSAVEHWCGGGFALAASWPFYAVLVFAAGLVLHERVYRWLALGVLGGTLVHIALIDIWELDSLGRFWSLLCLGLVLLGIGFCYTRYQAWLQDIF